GVQPHHWSGLLTLVWSRYPAGMRSNCLPILATSHKDVGKSQCHIIGIAVGLATGVGTPVDDGEAIKKSNFNVINVSVQQAVCARVKIAQHLIFCRHPSVGSESPSTRELGAVQSLTDHA